MSRSYSSKRSRSRKRARNMSLEIYVKQTSNVLGGMPLTSFQELSPTWSGENVTLPFGPEQVPYEVVGWTDLFFGSSGTVYVVKAQASGGVVGYLVYGGNSGVRILDEE